MKPSKAYGQTGTARLSGLAARLLQEVHRSAANVGGAALQADAAAHRAASEVALALPPSGPPPSNVVDLALRGQGIIDPPPHMVIADVPSGMEQQAVQQLGQRLESVLRGKAFNRVGVAVARPLQTPERQRVLVALFEHRILLGQPVPRQLVQGASAAVRFRVAASHHSPRLVVTDPAGKTSTLALGGDDQRVGQITCRRAGTYQVEITGQGTLGPEVLANFPVYCGVPPPVRVAFARRGPVSDKVEELERELVQGTNRARREAGLPPLPADGRLRDVARAHSRDMRDAGFVGHVSPTTGRPSDRMQAAGVSFAVVRENVAQAYSPQEALHELLNSPAHRANILSNDVKQLGVGVAVNRSGDTRVLLVTQLFARLARPYDPRTARAEVLRVVQRARAKVGLDPLRPDDELGRLAQQQVEAVARGGAAARAAEQGLPRALARVGQRFGRVDGLQIRVSVIEGIAAAEEIKRKRHSYVGVGVTKSGDLVHVFLLLAGPRPSG